MRSWTVEQWIAALSMAVAAIWYVYKLAGWLLSLMPRSRPRYRYAGPPQPRTRRFEPISPVAAPNGPGAARRPESHQPMARPLVMPQPPAPAAPAAALMSYHELSATLSHVPHIILYGATNAGKTTLAEALIRSRSGQVLVIDPDYEPGAWRGLTVVTTGDDDDYTPIQQALKALLAEMKRRSNLRKAGQIGTVPELTVIWDEIPDCVEECPSAGIILRRLARRSRKYKIRLIALSQSERVSAFGLERHGDALKNFVWIKLWTEPRAQGMVHLASIALDGETPRPLETRWIPDLAARAIALGRAWEWAPDAGSIGSDDDDRNELSAEPAEPGSEPAPEPAAEPLPAARASAIRDAAAAGLSRNTIAALLGGNRQRALKTIVSVLERAQEDTNE